MCQTDKLISVETGVRLWNVLLCDLCAALKDTSRRDAAARHTEILPQEARKTEREIALPQEPTRLRAIAVMERSCLRSEAAHFSHDPCVRGEASFPAERDDAVVTALRGGFQERKPLDTLR